MIKKAILATDLSKISDLLIDCVPEYKAMGIEHITLLHIPAISFNYMEYSGYSMMVHIEARMINLKNRLRQQGLHADFVFKEGLPSQEIIDYANNHPDSLIIIGSKGHGFHKRHLMGSTSLRVIQYSKNPVLLIRVKSLGKDEEGNYQCALESKKITNNALILTDFSEYSRAAFDFAKEHLSEYLKSISVMHVQDKLVMRHREKEEIEKFNKIDKERLSTHVIELKENTRVPVSYVLVEGAVVPEIIREVKEGPVSLVIMGTHGKGFFSDIVLGSTASAVIQLVESNCLLLPGVDIKTANKA